MTASGVSPANEVLITEPGRRYCHRRFQFSTEARTDGCSATSSASGTWLRVTVVVEAKTFSGTSDREWRRGNLMTSELHLQVPESARSFCKGTTSCFERAGNFSHRFGWRKALIQGSRTTDLLLRSHLCPTVVKLTLGADQSEQWERRR